MEKLWVSDLEKFKNLMGEEIGANMDEKGFTWRRPDLAMKFYLRCKMVEYIEAEKWVAIANMAFFLWDREQREVTK